jgi:hypothetical protein
MALNPTFEFTCASCGQIHQGSPSFSFEAPIYFSPEEKSKGNATLDSDFCVIGDEDYFIRTILEIPIQGHDEPFTWGVWVSLKKENFEAYKRGFSGGDQDGSYFGWFSNKLPFYANTVELKTKVHLKTGNERPHLELDSSNHELCRDFYDGISWDKAVRIATIVMHDVKPY